MAKVKNIPPRGGADLMIEGLKKHVGIPDGIHIISSTCNPDLVDQDRKNLLWQHIPADQEVVQGVRDKYFVRMIDAFVYVSHWQHEKFRYIHQIPLENAVVIKNAIEPIEFVKKPTGDKIRLIHTSVPYRGLEILLDAFELLNRDDIELDVYSSTIIYGSDYAKFEGGKYEPILNRARKMKDVNLIGYAPNEDVRKALQQAHIFAYPCIFEETACISMIEAGAAGCKMVTTNIGGLPETGSEWATLVPIQASRAALVASYAKALNDAIDSCKNWRGDEKQSEFYNNNYSWDNRKDQWATLFESLCRNDVQIGIPQPVNTVATTV